MKHNFITLIFITLFTAFFSSNISLSQTTSEEDLKHNLPKMLGITNAGQEFWFTVPPSFEPDFSSLNLIKIYVTSSVKTSITVEVPGKGYFKSKNTNPYEVTTFDLVPSIAQTYTKTGTQTTVEDQLWQGAGIHVFSESPIIVYCVTKYYSSSDGFLCLPLSALGKEYICAGYKVDSIFKAKYNYKLPSTCGITAPYNDTKVKFTMGGNNVSKTIGGMKPGDFKEILLQKGDVYMISTDADGSDLSGSKIVSNRPVSVVTGNMCTNIPTGNDWCDYTAEMDLPTFTWGTQLHVPKIPNRKHASIIRIFAKEPDTKIFRDGKQIGHIQYSGGIEGDAYIEMRMVPIDEKPRSVVISGDKPINVVLYNCGTQEDADSITSEPFVMAITPVEQYLNDVIFSTPTTNNKPDFSENYINLVYQTDDLGMMPDDLMFGEYINGTIIWYKIKSKFPGVDELFTYDKDNKKFATRTIVLPSCGVFRIKAHNPFAIYSFGFGYNDSYGYPATAGLTDLESIDSLPPIPKYFLFCNGNIDGAIVKDMPDDSQIRSNLAFIAMYADSSYNYIFDYDDFVSGQSRTTTWRLTTIDPEKPARAVIVFSDRRGNDTTITINFEPVVLTLIPSEINFGVRNINEFSDTVVTLKNESVGAKLIQNIKLKYNDQGFKIKDIPPLPFLMQPDESLNLTIEFNPTKTGIFLDYLGVGDSCMFDYKMSLSGNVGVPVIEASDINFGTELVQNTRNMQAYIKNSGSLPLTITSYSGPSLPVFTANIPPLPFVISPNQTQTFTVSFKPDKPGNYEDKIIFRSDAAGIDSITIINGNSIVNSVDEELDETITLSPVPADNILTISTTEENYIKSMEIFDLKMNIINTLSTENSQSLGEINVASYPNGTYYLIFDTAKGKVYKKFTIAR